MKKLLLIAVVALLSVASGVAVAKHYDNYQNKKEAEAQASEDATTARIASVEQQARDAQKALGDEIIRLNAECRKGEAAYEKLTPLVQEETPAPVCAK